MFSLQAFLDSRGQPVHLLTLSGPSPRLIYLRMFVCDKGEIDFTLDMLVMEKCFTWKSVSLYHCWGNERHIIWDSSDGRTLTYRCSSVGFTQFIVVSSKPPITIFNCEKASSMLHFLALASLLHRSRAQAKKMTVSDVKYKGRLTYHPNPLIRRLVHQPSVSRLWKITIIERR